MLETLLYPKSIAVIGASRSPEKVGYAVLANLVNGGFKGAIVPVNPGADRNPRPQMLQVARRIQGQDRLERHRRRGKIREGRAAQLH